MIFNQNIRVSMCTKGHCTVRLELGINIECTGCPKKNWAFVQF